MLCITDCCNLLLPFQLGLYLSRMILKHVTALSACKAMIRQGPSRRSASPAEGLSISDMCRLCFSSGVQSLPATRWQPVLSSRCSSSEYRGGWFCRRSLEGISRQVVWQRALLTKGPTGTKTQINNNGSQPHYKGRSQLVKHQQVLVYVCVIGSVFWCVDRGVRKWENHALPWPNPGENLSLSAVLRVCSCSRSKLASGSECKQDTWNKTDV